VKGSYGERVFALALMESDSRLAQFDVLSAVIQKPASSFEQYHALVATMLILDRLSAAERKRLSRTLNTMLRSLPKDSDRAAIVHRVINELKRMTYS